MGLREGSPLLVQTPRLLHAGCGVAQPDRIAGQAEAASDQVPMGEPLDHLWWGKMAVPTDPDRGLWPVATQEGEEPDQDHRVLRASGPRARAEAGRHQRAGEPCTDQPRQRALVLLIRVVEGALLLSVGRLVRVIKVEHDGRRWLRVAGDAVGHPRRGQPIEGLTGHAVCKPREGRRTRQGLLWSPWGALHAELKQGIATEAVGLIAVRLAGGDVIETLGPQVAQRVIKGGGRACIVDSGREACGQANLVIDAAE